MSARAAVTREQLHVVHITAVDGRALYRDGIAVTVTVSTRMDANRLPDLAAGEKYVRVDDKLCSRRQWKAANPEATRLAAHVVSWQGIHDADGQEIPCTFSAAVALLRMRPTIRSQLLKVLRLSHSPSQR